MWIFLGIVLIFGAWGMWTMFKDSVDSDMYDD